MPYNTRPTPRTKIFGRRLQKARMAKGMTVEEVAERANVSEAAIYRHESGHTAVKTTMVPFYIDLYGITDPSEVAKWTEWSKKAKLKGPWAASGGLVGPSYRDYADAEDMADELRFWELSVIPGLLQTKRVSEQVIRAGMLAEPGQPLVEPGTIDTHIALREERKKLLERKDNAPMVWAIVGEAALLTPPTMNDPEAHRDQLQHLLNLGETKATIQVVLQSSGPHAGLSGSFTCMTIDDIDLVHREGYGDGAFIDVEDQVRVYRTRFERLVSQALSINDTRRYLLNVLGRIGRDNGKGDKPE
ncbi:helix-turn-helix domain-containing protein [Streptomyces sp. cg35]|uniref:helix-turn-helix domain-containing protein n=1 Tax=Streptomyces sp. cg35 TaxID=3421650 RepID=UPI003D17BF68